MTEISQKILVIEDNPASRELVIYLLSAFGQTPIMATTGEQGLELAASENPDLILCDIQLPRMDGYEVCRQLKNDDRLRDIPLIAATAYAMVGDRERLLQAGFNGYISKPISPETFIDQLQPYFVNASAAGPARKRRGLILSEKDQAPAGTGYGKLLVVDNNRANRELLTQMLSSFGFKVTLADSAREAIEIANASNTDMIISDVHMPELDGFDFIKMVKNDPELSRIPFIFTSASYWGENDRKTGLSLGADRFITLPVEPEELRRQINMCLRKQEDIDG